MLSERELESRYEVWVEQYITRANIEAETADGDRQDDDPAGGAAPPGADRRLRGRASWAARSAPLVDRAARARSRPSTQANDYPDGVEGLELAEYARDHQLAAMAGVREVADKLEKVVPDDLWPLPKYSEILFVR